MTRPKVAALAEPIPSSTGSTPSDFSSTFGVSNASDLPSAPIQDTITDTSVVIPDFENTPSGELTTTLPDNDDGKFLAMLTEYNRTINGPANLQPTPPEYPVISAAPIEPVDDEAYMNFFDWAMLDNKNLESSQAIEEEYELEHAALNLDMSPFEDETIWDIV